jgi:phosphoribosylaminoimidazolecarboxamide formyltransferase/IMP cyclohydrolase
VKDLKEAYKTIEADHFAPRMEISFIDGDKRDTLSYEKVTWNIGGEEKGLRYGENPGQEAALYRLVKIIYTGGFITVNRYKNAARQNFL